MGWSCLSTAASRQSEIAPDPFPGLYLVKLDDAGLLDDIEVTDEVAES